MKKKVKIEVNKIMNPEKRNYDGNENEGKIEDNKIHIRRKHKMGRIPERVVNVRKMKRSSSKTQPQFNHH